MCVETSPPHASPSLDHIEVSMAYKVPKDLVKVLARTEDDLFPRGDMFKLKEKFPELVHEWKVQRLQEKADKRVRAYAKVHGMQKEIQKAQFDPGWMALDFAGMMTPLLRSTPGVIRAMDLGESVATTAPTNKFPQGRPVMDKILNWLDPKYEGKLWERPRAGFPQSGAYGGYHILKKQAPGVGIKHGGLSGERDFLRGFHDDIEVARRIYNADPVLMEYMPKLHTTPKHTLVLSKAMKPLEWNKIVDLPIPKQRQLFINFTYHARRLGKRLEKYGISAGDTHMDNWGITKEGKVQIMDIGGWSAGNSVGEGLSSGQRLLEKGSWRFDVRGHPGLGRLNLADAMAGKMKKGKLSSSEIAKPEFWEDAAREVSQAGTPSAPPAGPPLSTHAPNDPSDVIQQMGAHQPIEPPAPTIADPGTPSSGLMKELDAAEASLLAIDSPTTPPGQRTQQNTLEELKVRLSMYMGLDAERKKQGSMVSLWEDVIARMRREIAKREAPRAVKINPPPKSLTSDPAPSTITNHSEAMALHKKHLKGGNQGAANFWKRHADKIKKRQGWTSSPSDIVKEISK